MDLPHGASTEVWATILALVFLEICCVGQKDEWELIAVKAEAWLEGQALRGVSLASLREKARDIVTGSN